MNDTWYSVYVEAQATPGPPHAAGEGAADALMSLLEPHSGVVSAGENSWGATVSVQAADVRAAANAGTALIEQLAHKAGMPSWPAVRAEVVRDDVQEADLARPTLPEIVSVPEAADILGVSEQRVRELASAGRDFPEPVYVLRTGKLWLRAAIEAYGARRLRKPGRPAASGDWVRPDTARAEILMAARNLADPRDGSFTLTEIIAELRRAGSRYAESTIRTHVTSRMCADAPAHHGTTYDDFERLGGGRYRLRRAR